MIIKEVENEQEAKKCNELLTLLIHSESEYDTNLNKDYIVSNWFENIYQNEYNKIFIAIENDEIMGYIYCKLNFIESDVTNELEALIDGLYVEERFRNQGIATALINKAKEWSKLNGAKYINVNVLDKNTNALNLYKSNEFRDYERKLKCEL